MRIARGRGQSKSQGQGRGRGQSHIQGRGRDQGQSQGQGQGQREGQGQSRSQGQGQGQSQGQGQGQGQRGGQGQSQSQGQGQGQGQGQSQGQGQVHNAPYLIDEAEEIGTNSPLANLDHSINGSDSRGSIPSTAASTTSKRGKRGRNKCLELKELCKNGPIRLEIKKGNKGATGKRGGQFTRLVSLIVRDHADLHYASWTKVPREHMAMLRSRVRSYVILDMTRVEEELTLNGALQRSYNTRRSRLYNDYYKPIVGAGDGNAEDRAKVRTIIPKDMDDEAWPKICDTYDDSKWKKKCKRNKENKSKLKTNHTAGSKPFISYYDEETRKTGVEPRWIDFFKKRHTKKNGSFVNSDSEILYNRMQEKVVEVGADSVDSVEEASIVTTVLGGQRSGHVRGMGYGVIPTSSASRLRDMTQFDGHEECRKKQEERDVEVATMKKQIEMLMRHIMPGQSVENGDPSQGSVGGDPSQNNLP